MNLATIIGFAGSFIMVGWCAINTAGGMIGLIRLLNLPSFVLVILGAYFSVIGAGKMADMTGFLKVCSLSFKLPVFNEHGIITKLMAMSEKARREGLLALEEELEDLDDEFIKKGMRLVVDGTDAGIIRDLLELEINQMQSRHAEKSALLDMMSAAAPAFGMMGTVIGLVNMLVNLSDRASLGPNMAMAMITTLYGSLFANAMLLPWSSKLKAQDAQESAVREMAIEGILSIQAGDNPRILAMKLLAYLTPADRKAMEAEILKD